MWNIICETENAIYNVYFANVYRLRRINLKLSDNLNSYPKKITTGILIKCYFTTLKLIAI